MRPFAGWPKQAITWFEGLEADNSRSYFDAHRETYETCVRGPMEALLAAVADEFGDGKIFRPHRDVRFSRDKSPYKTHTAAIVGGGSRAGYYIDVSADGIAAGGGYRHLEREQLQRFRAAVADDRSGAALATAFRASTEAGLEPFGETLRTAPRGYARDHPRIDLLRRRDLTLVRTEPPGPVMSSAAALDWVVETWRALRPVMQWLDRHVGSAEPATR